MLKKLQLLEHCILRFPRVVELETKAFVPKLQGLEPLTSGLKVPRSTY